MNESSKLTRQTLYQSIWVQPMTKVAARLGISDVALRKICVKHNVPVPRIGYWAKVAAGKHVTQISLPPISGSRSEEIRIYGAPESRLPRSVPASKTGSDRNFDLHLGHLGGSVFSGIEVVDLIAVLRSSNARSDETIAFGQPANQSTSVLFMCCEVLLRWKNRSVSTAARVSTG
jgi:hypothetical protein